MLSQMNPLHIFTTYIFKITSLLRLDLQNGVFAYKTIQIPNAFIVSHNACLFRQAHPIPCRTNYKLSPTCCNFLNIWFECSINATSVTPIQNKRLTFQHEVSSLFLLYSPWDDKPLNANKFSVNNTIICKALQMSALQNHPQTALRALDSQLL
jgi:hypothetical protein